MSDENAPKNPASRPGSPSPVVPPQDAATSKKSRSFLPDWAMQHLKDPDSMKMLVRCWVVTFVTFLFLPINKALVTLGQAAFFCTMITFMVPSNMPVLIWFLANTTVVVGACLGWAWGAAATAAGLQARDRVLLASQLQTTQTSVASSSNPDAAYQQRIFQGAFLDTRSSVVHGVFIVTGAYFFGFVMAKAPKFKLLGIFGMIVLDINCSYGPLFPIAQYTLSTIFLLPIGASLGVGFGAMMFIFPQSLNYTWTRDMIKALRAQSRLLDMHKTFVSSDSVEKVQGAAQEEDDEGKTLNTFDEQIKGASAQLIALSDGLSGQAAFLELDVSRGRLSGKDLVQILPELKATNVRLSGLAAFPHLLQNSLDSKHAQDHVFGGPEQGGEGVPTDSWRDLKHPVQPHYTHTLLRAQKAAREAEKEQNVDMETLQPVMAKAAAPVLDACREALEAMVEWLEVTNKSRWSFQKHADDSRSSDTEMVRRIPESAEKLRSAHKKFIEVDRLEIFKAYEKHFKVERDGSLYLDEQGEREFRLGGRPLFLCMVWMQSVSRLSTRLVESTEHFHEVASKRSHNRIWLPRSLRKIGKIILSKKTRAGGPFNVGSDPAADMDDTNEDEDEEHDGDTLNDTTDGTTVASSGKITAVPANGDVEKQTSPTSKKPKRKAKQARPDPDAMPPSNPLHSLGRIIASVYAFAFSPDGLFCLRLAIVTFALWLPQVHPNSASFYYNNRGLWALIMGQLGLTVYSGEQVFSFVARVAGTVAGGLLGMVMWYISAGSGKGNPYAYSVVGGVVFIPLVFLRLYAPPLLLMPAIMVGVTSVMVYGYSWMDNHLAMRSNVGVGVEVFWRRTLLVIIGFAASFAVLVIGQPSSTRGLVRRCSANITNDLLRIYSRVIEAFIEKDTELDTQSAEGEKPSSGQKDSVKLYKELEDRGIIAHFLNTQVALSQLSTSHIGLASIDFAPRGHWPKERYQQIAKAQSRMLEALAQLLAVHLESINSKWQRQFFRASALLDPDLIAETCLHLSLISRSLATGLPLSHPSTGGLLNKMLKARAQARQLAVAFGDKSSISSHTVPLETLKDPEFMVLVTGLSAIHSFARACDELSAVTAALVGEEPLDGYDKLLDRREDELWTLVRGS